MNNLGKNGRGNGIIIAAAIICLTTGIALSHLIEPGIEVQHITLAGNTPALKFIPSTTGPHPVALLCHGVTASKETMFRLAESLATAGFVCYAIDFPGHGQSQWRFNPTLALIEAMKPAIHEIGPIDVFVGHSMGARVGAFAVQSQMIKPKLFIAIGAVPPFDINSPPTLLLDGKLEEIVSLPTLQDVPNSRAQVFDRCDHCSEVYDPRLVNAAVTAACESVGKSPPPTPTRWLWRILGVALAIVGAIALAICLPTIVPRLTLLRGPIVAFLFIAALALTTSTWLGAFPTLRRTPYYIVDISIACLLIAVRNKLRIPRWSVTIITSAITIILFLTGRFGLLPLVTGIVTLVLFAGGTLGKIAAFRGSRRDADFATAIFIGYAIAQWCPVLI